MPDECRTGARRRKKKREEGRKNVGGKSPRIFSSAWFGGPDYGIRPFERDRRTGGRGAGM